jgi:hypothetical protein
MILVERLACPSGLAFIVPFLLGAFCEWWNKGAFKQHIGNLPKSV